MSTLARTATFTAGDDRSHIAQELACPSCGYVDAAPAYRPTRDNRLHVFCDGCGAFITFTLSAEQAEALRDLTPLGRTLRSHSGMPA
jgi:hypothetical protein